MTINLDRIFIFLFIPLTIFSRTISYHFHIPVAMYFLLIVIIVIYYNRLLNLRIKYLDLYFLILILFPIIWAPFTFLNSNFEITQFIKTILFDMMYFMPFFIGRLIFNNHLNYYLKLLFVYLVIGIFIIFLQEYQLIGSLYGQKAVNAAALEADYGPSIAVFRDANNLIKFRNDSIFGSYHTAGALISIYMLYLLSLIIIYKNKTVNIFFFIASFFALFLTNSRVTPVLLILTIMVAFIFQRYFLNRKFIRIPISYIVILSVCITLFLIIFSPFILQSTIFGSLFSETTILEFLQSRLNPLVDTIKYFYSDTLQFLFGWGMGNGGVAAVQGIKLLPVNTVDYIFIVDLTHYGLLGTSIKYFLFFLILNNVIQKNKIIQANKYSNPLFINSILLMTFLSIFIGSLIMDKVVTSLIFFLLGIWSNEKTSNN